MFVFIHQDQKMVSCLYSENFFFFFNRIQRLPIMAGLLLATIGQFWAVRAAFLHILSPFSAQRQMRTSCRLLIYDIKISAIAKILLIRRLLRKCSP